MREFKAEVAETIGAVMQPDAVIRVDVEWTRRLCDAVRHLAQQAPAQAAAVRTLEQAGYTYHGGELWKPPIGKAPRFITEDTAAQAVGLTQEAIERLWDASPMFSVAPYEFARAIEREALARAEREMAGLRQMLEAERQRADNAVAVSNALQDKVSRASPSEHQRSHWLRASVLERIAENAAGKLTEQERGHLMDAAVLLRLLAATQQTAVPSNYHVEIMVRVGDTVARRVATKLAFDVERDPRTLMERDARVAIAAVLAQQAEHPASLHTESVKEDAESLQRGARPQESKLTADDFAPFYAAHHSRQAQGGVLSDEELDACWHLACRSSWKPHIHFARDILARARDGQRAKGGRQLETEAVYREWVADALAQKIEAVIEPDGDAARIGRDLVLRTIAEWPITPAGNMDAENMRRMARAALAAGNGDMA